MCFPCFWTEVLQRAWWNIVLYINFGTMDVFVHP